MEEWMKDRIKMCAEVESCTLYARHPSWPTLCDYECIENITKLEYGYIFFCHAVVILKITVSISLHIIICGCGSFCGVFKPPRLESKVIILTLSSSTSTQTGKLLSKYWVCKHKGLHCLQYCNWVNRNLCIVIRIISDSCQFTAMCSK